MRLITLGGSAAGPNPGQGCSGYLVSKGETNLVCDLGPGTLPELRRHVNFRELSAIVLSHLHLDHMLDLLSLRFALAYNPVAPRQPIPLWLPPGGRSFLGKLAAAVAEDATSSEYFSVFQIDEYDPRSTLEFGELQIRFHSTAHYVPCWAMRICGGDDGDLFYTADTGPTAQLASFAKGAFVVVAEGTEPDSVADPSAQRGHLTPTEAGLLASDSGAGVLVLTHLWAENDPFAAKRSAENAFSGPVLLATPGLKLEWTSRSIESADRRC